MGPILASLLLRFRVDVKLPDLVTVSLHFSSQQVLAASSRLSKSLDKLVVSILTQATAATATAIHSSE